MNRNEMYNDEKQNMLKTFSTNGEWEHFYDEVQILEERIFSDEERLKAAVPALLSWFAGHARILPWRENPTPYRVWLSEIMLQQTRVEAVKPYFERFVQELPDIGALASAEEDRLLKLWEGLGYYSRVRNLNRAAKQVMEEYGGELPSDCQKLLKLPGIGSYTAGAVSSIAFGQKVPAVDGNVLRVISRVLASRGDISEQTTKKSLETLLEKVMPANTPGEFNQALMEVGATVCIPRGEPLCGECPFYTLCLSRRDGLIGEIPVKKIAKSRRIEQRTVLLLWDGNRVAVRKRPEKGLLAGLYEFPNMPGWVDEDEAMEAANALLNEAADRVECSFLGEAVHVFSHVEWHMVGYAVRITGKVPERINRWADSELPENNVIIMADGQDLKNSYAIPNAFRVYTEKITELLDKDRN